MKKNLLFSLMLLCSITYAGNDECVQQHLANATNYIASSPEAQRAALRFVCEVPFNNVAANTVPGNKSILDSLKQILGNKGSKGLYSGAPLEMVCSTLWWPRMWLLEHEPKRIKSTSSFKNPQHAANTLTAAEITLLEALCMPLFRLRNAQMLAHGRITSEQLQQLRSTLYAGTTLRSIAIYPSWLAFLYSNDTAKTFFPDKKAAQLTCTTLTQLLTAIVTAPIYVVILLRQHPINPCQKPFWDSLTHQHRLYGMPLFHRTAAIGAGHLVLQGVLTNLVQQKPKKKEQKK